MTRPIASSRGFILHMFEAISLSPGDSLSAASLTKKSLSRRARRALFLTTRKSVKARRPPEILLSDAISTTSPASSRGTRVSVSIKFSHSLVSARRYSTSSKEEAGAMEARYSRPYGVYEQEYVSLRTASNPILSAADGGHMGHLFIMEFSFVSSRTLCYR